ncbi:MAG TPA: ABC transporter substrate-binding protein [Pseudonocardiaceae bacterium]|nr:ABC transporter substrate-binding protein [Pseudonocardiaceae bacterium]
MAVARRRLFIAALAAVCLGATACTTTSGAGGSGDDTVGITQNSIKIGTSMGLTGPTAAEATAALHGAQAYFDYVNDHGGVNGRKIDLTALDDGFTAAQTVTNVRRLVQQDNVFSLFYLWGLNNTVAVLPFVKQSGVPLIGPQSPTSAVTDPVIPNVFLMEPTFNDEAAVCAKQLADSSSVHKLGILYENDPIGQDALKGAQDAEGHLSKPMAAKVAFTSGTPSFTGQIVSLRQQGVDGLIIFGTNPDIVNIAKGISLEGWHPALCGSSNVFDPTFLSISGKDLNGLNGSLGQYLPESTEPGIVTYRNRLKQYFPNEKATVFGVQAYGEAQILVHALQSLGKNPTRAGLLTALNSLTNYSSDTLFPVSFTKTNHDGVSQYRLVKVVNGQPQFTSGFLSNDSLFGNG